MLEFLQSFFADGLFIPHGHCYLWKTELVWMHIISDSLIALSYYSIPISLVYFVQKRQDLPFKWILLLFGTFIISCGTTHVMEVWTLWHPTYWLSGTLKIFTAFVSVYTAVVLVPIIPKALALPSPAQLEVANSQLKIAFEELANTQAQLIHTEKMSSLEQLVTGIAHEINNPVNFIYGNITPAKDYSQELLKLITLYQEYYPEPVPQIQDFTEQIDIDFIKEDLPKILSSIKIGAERIHQIVLSLRNFLRLDEADVKKVDIHQGIDSALLILGNSLKAKLERPAIKVIKEYANLPKVECYPGQLNQVFMNILSNAIDALEQSMHGCEWVMPSERPKSIVEINDGEHRHSTSTLIENDKPQICIFTEVLDSNQVIIRIIDNGCGMTQEVKQRIFDPFKMAKPVISSKGLGILISHEILSKYGGQLKCISTPLKGTEFIIQIPIYIKSVEAE